MEKIKKTAAHAVEMQGQQYTDNELASVMIKTMFSTFAQTASCGIDAKVHG